ncbi:MAG: hypothetical protein JST12_01560 [Armatimonadetes bacterium]|nr:hypothetical protein [Armatimonadota bacterium]MBS1700322.1 hypothetical protein [Armatimonadota bacterium]MBS1727763.1 hypothetical protein [Armatimonadota bacterium]
MKLDKKSWFLLAVTFAAIVLAGCDPNPGGLSDEQKLEGARKARNQQMGQQAGNMPMNRNAMPGASNGQ